MGRVYYGFSDAWAKNERMAKALDEKEGHYVAPEKGTKRRTIGPRGKSVELTQDAALGLDGSEFHMGGKRVTNLKEEAIGNGDVNVYWQSEDGGTYIQRWAKVNQGRHTPAERPRRIFSF